MVDVIVLPVVRIALNPDAPADAEPKRRRRKRELPPVLSAEIVDINAFRYARERAVAERRSSKSLLPDLGSPCDCGDGA